MICILAHFIAGLLSALAVRVSRTLAGIGFVGFEIYEIGQYFEKGDWPNQETMQYMAGLFVGIAILIYLSFVSEQVENRLKEKKAGKSSKEGYERLSSKVKEV